MPNWYRLQRVCVFAALISLCCAVLPLSAAPSQAVAPGWRTIRSLPYTPVRCVDPTAPTMLLVAYTTPNEADLAGTYMVDWTSGQIARVSEVPFEQCDPGSGALFAATSSGGDRARQRAVRFSRANPQLQPIAHTPEFFARDGTRRAYAVARDQGTGAVTSLWASDDGGLNWAERPLPGAGAVGMAAADSRVLYLVTAQPDATTNSTSYGVYATADTGQTWEQRSSGQLQGTSGSPELTLQLFESPATPLDSVILAVTERAGGQATATTLSLSADGGRSFTPFWQLRQLTPDLVTTGDGVVRLTRSRDEVQQPPDTLALSTDGGRTWQPLALPGPLSSAARLLQVRNAPNALLLAGANAPLYYSPDGGRSWRDLGPSPLDFLVTTAVPHHILRFDAGQLAVLDLPDVGRALTAPARPLGATGGRYFPETGQMLSPLFLPYWEANGGLAQFGYPRTPAFLEVNPDDGRAYLVQYVERNRFEYHPELAGTSYEVLLGLLGNQLTASRRATQEAPFRPRSQPGDPALRFFPETGHVLDPRFQEYWEANGGLAIYGFPMSEAFIERNPEDGQNYLVQYFERNRFEYHPELAGTSYEVLLGLLGNTVLRERGWLD